MSDQSPQAKALAPEKPAPKPAEPEDHERGYVLRGYKKVAETDHNWYLTAEGGAYEFRGGISIGRKPDGTLGPMPCVPYSVYKEWKKQPGAEFVHWLPASAKPADFLKAAKVQPADPQDVATQLEAADTEAVLQKLGLAGAQELMKQLQRFIDQHEQH